MSRKVRRVVIKVGTSTLTDSAGRIDRTYMASLTHQIAELRSIGIQVVLVTSGAIRAGVERLGMPERPTAMPQKQAAAAVGQSLLMHMYSEIFGWHGLTSGQVLLTKQDLSDRARFLNARNTMMALLRHGVVPVVNENDTVAVDEIKVGDNDNLAALVASSIEADMLIILSDVPGLYSRDPSKASETDVIRFVEKIDTRIRALAGGARSVDGTGGMRTKIEAAEIATKSGVSTIIADGRRPNVIVDAVNGLPIGTRFLPAEDRLRGRKRWIAFSAVPKGNITVNDGARRMIAERGKSLLAAGIVGVAGGFSAGDLVSISSQEGTQFARGFVNYSAEELDRIKGLRSSEVADVLGRDADEVIHRDNMALGI